MDVRFVIVLTCNDIAADPKIVVRTSQRTMQQPEKWFNFYKIVEKKPQNPCISKITWIYSKNRKTPKKAPFSNPLKQRQIDPCPLHWKWRKIAFRWSKIKKSMGGPMPTLRIAHVPARADNGSKLAIQCVISGANFAQRRKPTDDVIYEICKNGRKKGKKEKRVMMQAWLNLHFWRPCWIVGLGMPRSGHATKFSRRTAFSGGVMGFHLS